MGTTGTNINCILMTLYALKAIKLISNTAGDSSEGNQQVGKREEVGGQVRASACLHIRYESFFLYCGHFGPFRVHFEI